ncbi:MAG: hypothetical protein D6780_02985 [Candidatus Dadabacteria bacterium]|nr:MAG: hypothetical protein D6780_02985 [Candidatus Dadabacteria bacterium]
MSYSFLLLVVILAVLLEIAFSGGAALTLFFFALLAPFLNLELPLNISYLLKSTSLIIIYLSPILLFGFLLNSLYLRKHLLNSFNLLAFCLAVFISFSLYSNNFSLASVNNGIYLGLLFLLLNAFLEIIYYLIKNFLRIKGKLINLEVIRITAGVAFLIFLTARY